jgi:hypothetical protein
MKFLRPLYRDLFKTEKGTPIALETFEKYKTGYHGIAQKMVAKDLGVHL